MNKKLTSALIALLITLPYTAHANSAEAVSQVPSLAILDTALDTSLPIFEGKIAQEVCILDWNSCPNGKNFQEGPGSAVIPLSIMATSSFNHGTQMASVAIQSNPNMKIVFVRIIGHTVNGSRQISGPSTVVNALNWVAANKEKYNIVAVSMSQGHHNLLNVKKYCPINAKVQSSTVKLLSMGVPFFTAAGNSRDYNRIDWPSCTPEAISIGATDQIGEIASYSNSDLELLDFFALGIGRAYLPGGAIGNIAGTSAATQVAAAQWVMVKQLKPSLSYSEQYDLFVSKSINTSGRQGTFKKLIDLGGMLNG